VDYRDSLTEKEWLKVIGAMDENGEPLEEEEVDIVSGKRKRRKKRRRGEDDAEGDEPKKRNRKSDAVAGSSSSSSSLQKGTAERLKNQMKKLMNIVITYQDSDGRTLSEPFMKLPSRKELPDYYEIIKKPMDIKKILSRIEDGKVIVQS
jgi:SWI/SNF-related matrix-associated actin-dependent regulator of chromatin subfamily A protein 2/4